MISSCTRRLAWVSISIDRTYSPSRSFKQVSSDTISLLLGTLDDFLMHATFGLGVDPDQPDVFAFMIVQTSL
jgi:hypothetical protein